MRSCLVGEFVEVGGYFHRIVAVDVVKGTSVGRLWVWAKDTLHNIDVYDAIKHKIYHIPPPVRELEDWLERRLVLTETSKDHRLTFEDWQAKHDELKARAVGLVAGYEDN